MDPVTGAIVAIVIWLAVATPGAVLLTFLSSLIGDAMFDEGGIIVGGIIGWVLGWAWVIFALIMAILQFVHLAQLLTLA